MQTDSAAPAEAQHSIPPGALLRQAREARGESLGEVAQALKLSLRQLEALENGHHDALPGPAFVRGFLRNYARHVGVDPGVVLAGLDGNSTAVDLTPLSNAKGEMPVGRSPRFNLVPAAAVAGVLLLVMLAGGYFGWFETPPASESVPAAVEPFLPPEEESNSGEADETATETVEAPPADQAAAAQEPAAASPESAAESSAAAAAPEPAPAAPEGGPADGLRFSFSADSWIEVRDASGAIIYSGLGTAGNTRNVQGRPPFALVIGNARSVRLEYQGREVDLAPHTKVSVARLTVQ